jgi:hypothetical protein
MNEDVVREYAESRGGDSAKTEALNSKYGGRWSNGTGYLFTSDEQGGMVNSCLKRLIYNKHCRQI